MKEEDIRNKVRLQREFYTQAVHVGIANIILILIWMLFDSHAGFWPKYVIVVSLIGLAIKAYTVDLLPFFTEQVKGIHKKLYFMSDEWEEEKVDEMMGKKKTSPKTTTAKAQKPAQKKVVGRTKKNS